MPVTLTMLAALGVLLALLGARLGDYRLAISPADVAAGRILQQFEDVEHNADTVFAWSRPRAALALFGLEGRALLIELRAASPRPAGAIAATLTLGEGSAVYGRFAVGGDWRRYRVLLPPRSANERAIRLESPLFDPPGADARELGVALSTLRVAALPPAAWWPAPFERALYLGLWPAFAALATYRTKGIGKRGQRRFFFFVMATVLLLVVALAAAFPEQSSYLLPTIWLLPVLLVALPWAARLLRRSAARVRAGRQQTLTLWTGLALAAVGQALLAGGVGRSLGAAMLALGGLLAASALPSIDRRQETGRAGDPRLLLGNEGLLLGMILLISLALRLYRLDELPLGMFRDEARHGLQAMRIWYDPGYRPVYVVFGAHLPALLFYLMAPIVGVIGPTPWTVRIVPALAGALTPLALWWLVRPIWGRRPALVAATLLAVASWALNMSRWAFPASLDPLLMTLALGLLWRGLHMQGVTRRAKIACCAFAGAWAALAAYTYHSGRFAPLLLALAGALMLGTSRARWREATPYLAAAAMAGLLVLLPLLHFIVTDFAGYTYRVERVQLFKDRLTPPNTPVGVIVDNSLRYLAMWHVEGDANGRHHYPRAPMLDPVSGTLLMLGLLLALRWPVRGPTLLLLSWLAVGLLPGIFSIEAPHAMRSFDALIPACILAALGGEALLHRLEVKPRRLRLAMIAVLAAFALAWNCWIYFVAFGQSRDVYTRFDVVETYVARALREVADGDDPDLHGYRLLLSRKLATRDVVEFLAAGIAYGKCDQQRCIPEPGGRALLLLDGAASADERAAALRVLGPGAVLLGDGPRYPDNNQPIFLVYGVGPEAGRAFEMIK